MQKMTDEAALDALIRDLTAEEKVNLTVAASACLTEALEERDIPSIVLADGATGVNDTHILLDFFHLVQQKAGGRLSASNSGGNGGGKGNIMGSLKKLTAMPPEEAEKTAKDNPLAGMYLQFLKRRRNPAGQSIAFPSGVNIGACFDEKQAYAAGRALGLECCASNLNVCLGPNADIARDPMGGRNYEMYGEDPLLVGNTTAAFVRGLQSTGTAACVKHMIANNQETRRQTKDTHVSVRTLRELYAKGFEKAVKKGGVQAVMSAYNAVNGVFSSYNRMILTEWLKEEWGFQGTVVSDWGAVTEHGDESIAAGMDLVLHGPKPFDRGEILEGLRKGTLSEERLNDAVRRVLGLVLWVEEQKKNNPAEFDFDAICGEACKTVEEGAVLLKNEGVLPLDEAQPVAFYGSCARKMIACGSGSTFVNTSLLTNPFDEAKALGVTVSFEDMNDAETVVYVAGAGGGENADRDCMDLDAADRDAIVRVLREARECGKKTVVVLNVSGPVDMQRWLPYADAILVVFIPGSMGGRACARLLFGRALPGGRLPVSFPVQISDSPAWPYPIGERDDIFYSEGVFVGYRWYDAKKLKTQFPFGYGLSYTSFRAEPVHVPASWDIREKDRLEVSVRVRNTGAVRGCELIQLYLGYESDRLAMPVREMKAYQKIWLDPGEEQLVTLTVEKDDLTVYDPECGSIIPIGTYCLSLGRNSESIEYTSELIVQGDNPYRLGENSTLGDLMDSPEAFELMKECVPQFFTLPEAYLRNMRNEKIGPLLAQRLISSIPDANQLKTITDRFFRKLSELQ